MELDIRAGVVAIFILLIIAAILTILRAYSLYKEAMKMRFFVKRKAQIRRALLFTLGAVLIIGFSVIVNLFAEPIIYQYYEPSPTVTLTPTVTMTPTITLTPTPTTPPTITPTPLYTPIPELSIIISSEFSSNTTPNPNAVFSPILFAKNLDEDIQPIEPSDTFELPVNVMYGAFSYVSMIPGVQWTALWFRDGELICYETLPWNGASGGFGYTECELEIDRWLPGNYEVQIFVGEQWKQTGNFRITGSDIPPENGEISNSAE